MLLAVALSVCPLLLLDLVSPRHSLLHQREGEDRTATLATEVCGELLKPRVYDGLLR